MTEQSDLLDGAILAFKVIMALPFLLPFALIIVAIRLANELMVRTVGKAVVICPHCGAPGMVQSRNPRVIR